MSPDRTVLDPSSPPDEADLHPTGRATDGPRPRPTVGSSQPGASNSDFTTDLPSAAAAADPQGTVGGDYTPSLAADPSTATGDLAGAKSSGPPSLSKRPLPTVPGYAIHGILGRGGMGVVYRATQVGLGRQVALKMVLAAGHASAAQLARFQAEARAVAHVRHPSIIQIYEIGEQDGLPYFSLELCTGGSLDKLLNHEPQPPQKAAAILEKLARAMGAAHTANIIHRDIKPANVLLDEHGEPKITDFGLARELDDVDGATRTGSILGTPSYMAPEQARGETKKVGAAADQYSLGATLYDLLTGRPPFQGTSVMETLEQVRNREPLSPREMQPGVPKDLETICLKALAKEQDKRYPSCDAMADDLRAFLDGRPISARPVGRVEKAWRLARRNPGVAIPSAAATVLVLAVAILGVTFAVVFDKQKKQAVALASDLKVSLENEQAAKKEADDSNAYTQAALQKAVVEVPQELKRSLYGGVGRQSALALIGSLLADQLTEANLRRLPDRSRVQYHVAQGDLVGASAGMKAAEAEFRKALALAEPLAAADPVDKGRATTTLGQVLVKLGQAEYLQTRPVEGEATMARAEAVMRRVVADPACGDVPLADRRLNLAGTLGVIGDQRRTSGYFDQALKYRQEQVEVLTTVATDADAPDDARRRATVRLADALRERGLTRAKLGQDDAAEADLRAAAARGKEADDAERADKTRRPDDGRRREYARTVRELADFLLTRGKVAEATEPHRQLIALNKDLAYDPDVMAQRRNLASAYYRAGMLREKRDGAGQGVAFFRLGLAIMAEVSEAAALNAAGEASIVGPARVQQALFAARCGDHAAATRDLPALVSAVKNLNNQSTLRYNAATVYAVASAAPGAPAEKYRTEAFAHLDTLLAPPVALADPVRLTTDPDLEPLRADPRFAAAVAKAEANQKDRKAKTEGK